MAQRSDREPNETPLTEAKGTELPMGLHPERLAGTDSAAAGGDTSRGMAGLDPRRLTRREQDATNELVEMQIDGSQVLVGVFDDRDGARRAIDALEAADGYDPNEIAVTYKDGHEIKRLTHEFAPGLNSFAGRDSDASTEPEAERMEGQVEVGETTKANLGTGVGLLAGAGAGAALGLAAMQIPGISGLLAAGGGLPAALIGGAAVGAGIGAWGGSLAGVATPEDEYTGYEDDLEAGHWLVVVRTNRIDEAFALLRDAGARNFQEHAAAH